MRFEMRRLRRSLLDHYLSNKEAMLEDLKAGSWDLIEGVSFACEYPTLQSIAQATTKRQLVSADHDEDGPMPDEVIDEIEERAAQMHDAISQDGFFIDLERCFVVLRL